MIRGVTYAPDTCLHDMRALTILPGVKTIGQNVIHLRERAGLSQAELARRMGVPASRVWDLESNRYMYPDVRTLIRAATAMGCSVEDLLEGVYPQYDPARKPESSNVEPTDRSVVSYKKNDIPLVGEVEADPDGRLSWDETVDPAKAQAFVSRPEELNNEPNAVAFKVRGDSMAPMFPAGTELIVAPRMKPEEGKPAIFVFKDGRHLLKIYHRVPGGYLLESVNRSYPPRTIRAGEVEAIYRVRYARY